MHTALWIAQGLLAVVFVVFGGLKLAQTKEQIVAKGGKWAEDFQQRTIKLIGVVEVLCGLGVVVPRALGHGYYLTFLSAAGIMVVMAGAFSTHVRRKETPFLGVTGIIFAIGA